MTDRKNPGVAFWATVVMVVGLLYVASFGPLCWTNQRTKVGGRAIYVVYYPMLWAATKSKRIDDGLLWYAGLVAPDLVTPVFVSGELNWEDVWQTLVRRKNWHRWNYGPASRLAPTMEP
jgi:hypothetical protein